MGEKTTNLSNFLIYVPVENILSMRLTWLIHKIKPPRRRVRREHQIVE